MKRVLRITTGILVGLCLVLQAFASIGHASPGAGHTKRQSGDITIQSWLLGNIDNNGLSGTVKACFKLKGAFVDQGGDPTWSDSTYTDPASPANKCGDWQPVGGFVFVPGVTTTDTTVYANHTITGQKGQIFITFSGTYDLVNTYQTTAATWVITGGTGAYTGVMGEGTATADASLLKKGLPYIRHTETGQMWRLSGS